MASLRVERVGWSRELCDPEASRKSIEKNKRPPQDVCDIQYQKETDLHCKILLALKHWLLEQILEAKEAAREAVSSAEEYFFGEWRQILPAGNRRELPPDPEYFHRHAAWAHSFYPGATMWAACTGDWQFVKRLSGYVTRDCKLDIDQTNENRAWLLILAGSLRGDSLVDYRDERGLIVSGRAKREKLLLVLLESILDPSPARVESATKDYFKHYSKVEAKRQLITSKVAIDGSILVQFAERRGTPLPIPASLDDYIVRL
jgi:hypothetical protein